MLAYEAQKAPAAFGPESVETLLEAFDLGYVWEAAGALLEDERREAEDENEDPEPDDEVEL